MSLQGNGRPKIAQTEFTALVRRKFWKFH